MSTDREVVQEDAAPPVAKSEPVPVVTGKRPREEEVVPQTEASTTTSATIAEDKGNGEDEDEDEDDEDSGLVDDMPVSHEVVLKDHVKVRPRAVTGLEMC